MTTGSDLVVAATVGTAHRSIDLAALPDQLRPEPIAPDPAFALLDAAALSALARRTVLPTVPVATGAPATPVSEKLPVVPVVVRQVLTRVLHQPAVLVEALTLIRKAGLRLPPEMVPGLLDDNRDEVVAATRPVAGEIGRLLMTKNPRWAAPAVLDLADRTIWDEGTTAQRLEWLRALRRTDPDAARDLLAESFSRETATTRAEMLTVLTEGISEADLQFLESAADDRSRAVGEQAAFLLTRLPNSGVRRHMRELAAQRLTISRRLGKTTVTVGELSILDLRQWAIPIGDLWTALLSRVDPAEWPQIFRADLLQLIADETPELYPLYTGFRLAATSFRNAGLARVLVEQTLTRGGRKTPPTVDRPLWAVLDPSDAIVLFDRLLGHQLVRADQVGVAALTFARPWSPELARRFARWLPTGGGAGLPAPRTLWELWASATALPDCRALADLARGMTDAAGDRPPPLTTRASGAANLLTLRAVLYETLGAPGGNT